MGGASDAGKKNEYIEEAVQELEKINSDPEKRYEYLYCEMKDMDENTIRNYFTEKGKEEEATRYSRLILKLSEAGRIDQVVKAAEAPDYLQELYREFEV